MDKVVVIGQGYVGLPLAMRAGEAGHRVVGVDVDARRIKQLSVGRSDIADVSDDQVRAALDAGIYVPTDDYGFAAGFDVCVITVPTPLRDGAPDLSHIEDAARRLAPYVRPGCLVVLESTTYPGTTVELLQPILEDGSGLRAPTDFSVGYSPERIDPGNPRWDLRSTPKIVSGIDDVSRERAAAFYGTLVDHVVPVSNTRTAELTKLLENTFRHVNIALVNELAVFAGELGVDVWEAVRAAATKPFGFMPFLPGPGVGGHCLPIDPSYLSWHVKRDLGHPFRFIELANDVNHSMPRYVVQRLVAGLNARRRCLNGSRILLLGLAYKRNVGDLRESPAVAVVEGLLAMGATVDAAEPHLVAEDAAPPGVRLVELTAEAVRAADAVVVLTDHDRFDYDLLAEAAYVFDTRNRCAGPNVELL